MLTWLDAQREQKEPSHEQVGHVNKVEESWKDVQSNYLSFVGWD